MMRPTKVEGWGESEHSGSRDAVNGSAAAAAVVQVAVALVIAEVTQADRSCASIEVDEED